MRHRVATKTLSRTSAHRKALVKNLSAALIEHEKIETTLAKAKFLRPYVERLITRAKNTDQTSKIEKFNTIKYLRTKLTSEDAIRKLVGELGPRFGKRNGGYTRITRTRNRLGDNTMMARIEFVESPKKDTVSKEKEALKSKTKKVIKEGAKKSEE